MQGSLKSHFNARLIALLLFLPYFGACISSVKKEVSDDLQVTEVKIGGQSIEYSSEPPQLIGNWKSANPDKAGNGRYSVRELKFTENGWEMKYSLSSNKSMSQTLFTYKASGTYQLQNPSKRIPGGYLIAYRFQKKSLEIQTKDKKTLKEFGFDECQNIGVGESDISSYGCGLFTRISECQVDYDLIRQHESQIELGDRYAEFTSCSEDKRPVALGFTLEKQK